MVTAAEQQITEQSDALAEMQNDLVGNSYAAVMQRERDEHAERKHVSALAGEHAAARYRKIALCSRLLTDAEFRLLCLIVEKADGTLRNSFASPGWLQKHLGGRPRKNRRMYALIASLERKQFLSWHKGKGWQFRLPEGALAPSSNTWNGPEDWSKRWKEEA